MHAQIPENHWQCECSKSDDPGTNAGTHYPCIFRNLCVKGAVESYEVSQWSWIISRADRGASGSPSHHRFIRFFSAESSFFTPDLTLFLGLELDSVSWQMKEVESNSLGLSLFFALPDELSQSASVHVRKWSFYTWCFIPCTFLHRSRFCHP